MEVQATISAFQADAFQFDAFQIFDDATVDDGITKTIVPPKYITATLSKLPQDDIITVSIALPTQITA